MSRPLRRRHHPLFSPLALGGTLLLLLLLGVALWLMGGRAFSPGPLSAVARTVDASGPFNAHADFGDSCTQCHLPLQGVADRLCLDCHTEIGAQKQRKQGLHGELSEACAACHQEHLGSTVDLVEQALVAFSAEQHQALFELHGAHLALDCGACHWDGRFAQTPRTCEGCHAEPERHADLFGTACANCHVESAWQLARMQSHSFPLDHGELGEQACAACHAESLVSYRCTMCHAEPAMEQLHAGLSVTAAEPAQCTSCHSSATAAETERLRNGR